MKSLPSQPPDWVVKDPIPCQTNLQRRIWQRRTPERQHLEHSSNI